MKARLCLLLLLSITGATLTYAQGEKKPRTIADYQPRTLQELANLLPEPFRVALAERGVEGNKNLKQLCGSLRIFAVSALKYLLTQRTQRYAESHRERINLRTPESAVECGLADRGALAGAGFAGRAAVATDPGIAVLIAIDIAASTGGELRPAALEGPIGWRSRLCYTRSEEKNKENYGNG
jgi:hypothetical protein